VRRLSLPEPVLPEVSGPDLAKRPAPEPRYQFKPFRYSSHDWILRALEHERKPVKILDVGTASGYLGIVWTAKGHSVTGIEYDVETAENARRYYDAFEVADVETFEFPYRREFDYIVFADVLEHLRDPAAVLRRCLPALKESGKIIISVPNVANWVIRLSLLLGRFDYMDRGILDRTHLRFFTLRSLKQMMSEASCRVIDVKPTPLPVQLLFPFTESKIFDPFHALHHMMTRILKTFFAYQFVITAVSSGPQLASGSWPESDTAGEQTRQ
jgi:2-polyprenyl-3-methyl-5-hydroxy-6-metoxy-1,4-benzoquinol methylase